MKIVPGIVAFCILVTVFSITAAQVEGVKTSDSVSLSNYEIESQLPCLLFGGYQMSIGKRYQQYRFRVSIVNSGRADFEPNGFDRRNTKFQRSYDAGSFSVSADYFLNLHWFSYLTLQNNRWLLKNIDTLVTEHINTIEAGVGTGLQYYFYKDIFAQLSFQVNFRGLQSIRIESEDYTIPGFDWTPGLRLGIRF